MKVFTIGFTRKSAEKFFNLLSEAGVRTLIDVRLNNVSQLAGFSKKDDLRYFLKAISGIGYTHMPELAPTSAMLDEYKKQSHDWGRYESQFLELMSSRSIESKIPKAVVDGACLLCSEEKPGHCHRRLVAEYLRDKWGGMEIEHL